MYAVPRLVWTGYSSQLRKESVYSRLSARTLSVQWDVKLFDGTIDAEDFTEVRFVDISSELLYHYL